jgi:hypothetical protein
MFVARSPHKEIIEQIMDRASYDLDFRQRLLVDPKTTIYEELGVRVPASYKVRFIEKDRDIDSLVVLPDYQDPSGELSDDDLEAVAGGNGPDDPLGW